ncbi:ester cyclase [Oscillatoria sp. FACHB-1407]|uniref:ester cyclase n=1 Tax=Oscillatoria sp. FACHB-1407 TaxID=2692847 RepID=UPI0016844599|nr:ester cyclase [Oscillatoria sp. FACHB-1407]MBD2459841.1 ester cyclase [Oscillatoria sp. FACHB-1407]
MSTSDANKRLMRRYFDEVWNQKNLAVLDEIISPDHIRFEAGAPQELRGPEGVKQFIQTYMTAFPDAQLIVEDLFAEGDKVAVRWLFRGTHQGYLRDIPPTGNVVTNPGMTIAHIVDGKMVQYWTSWDTLMLMAQLSLL